jgi:hypothetical protein
METDKAPDPLPRRQGIFSDPDFDPPAGDEPGQEAVDIRPPDQETTPSIPNIA